MADTNVQLTVQTLSAPIRPSDATPARGATDPTAGTGSRFSRADHAHLAPVIDVLCMEAVDPTAPPATIDGTALEDGMAVGLAAQTSALGNGVFRYTDGVLERHPSYELEADLHGAVTSVRFGTLYGGTTWRWWCPGTVGSVPCYAATNTVVGALPTMPAESVVSNGTATKYALEVTIPIGESSATINHAGVNESTLFWTQLLDAGSNTPTIRIGRDGGQFNLQLSAAASGTPVTVAVLIINPASPPEA